MGHITIRMSGKRNRKRPAFARLLFSLACTEFVFTGLLDLGFSAPKESPNPLPALKMVNAFPGLKFINPIRIRNLGDGSDRLSVGTQTGKIFVFKNSSDVSEKKLFLSVKSKHQLMDFVFHPDFSENGYVFTYYRSGGERAQRSVLSRFKVDENDGDRVDPKSEKVILEIPRSFHFSNLLGTMMRIDVDSEEQGRPYRIPDDNPFIGNASIPDQVWAYGFREPWRFCFDPKTGNCWLGDNGQWAYEEVNLIIPGGNYAWPFKEGFLPFNKKYSRKKRGGMEKNASFRFGEPPDTGAEFIDPVIEYPHRIGVCVVGGEFYYGEKIPELLGAYIYGDYQYGRIWGMRWDGTKVLNNQQVARIYSNLSSFGKDEAGEIYVTAFDGNIYKFEKAPPSVSPKP